MHNADLHPTVFCAIWEVTVTPKHNERHPVDGRWSETFRADRPKSTKPDATDSNEQLPPTSTHNAPSPSPRLTDESWAALKALDPIGFNAGAERAFLALAVTLIAEGTITTAELIQETAYELDISVATARRYLLKHTARHATLTIVGGHVQYRNRSSA